MSSRFLFSIAAAASALLASCYPYPEVPPPFREGPPNPYGPQVTPPGPTTPPRVVVSPAERERQRIRDEERRRAQANRPPERREQTERQDSPPPPRNVTPPQPETPKPTYPVALKVVGREGFVISPYNKKQIDVSEFSPGQLVRDPLYPASEKKFFRVP